MDPITLSTVASVLLKAGPSLVRTVGGWFGSDAARAADSVASIVEIVNGVVEIFDVPVGDIKAGGVFGEGGWGVAEGEEEEENISFPQYGKNDSTVWKT